MTRFCKQTLFVLGLTVIGMFGAGSAARAGWGLSDLDPFNGQGGVNQSLKEFDQARLNAMAPGYRAGRDFSKVFIKNNTKEEISVAALAIPFEVNATDLGPSDSPFQVLAWYNLKPGERVHIANTNNTYVYFYAQSRTGTWGGKATYRDVRDGAKTRRLGFQQQAIIDMPEEWTMNFNP
jgi:hypothetical protein